MPIQFCMYVCMSLVRYDCTPLVGAGPRTWWRGSVRGLVTSELPGYGNRARAGGLGRDRGRAAAQVTAAVGRVRRGPAP